MEEIYVTKKEQLYKIKSRQPFKFKCVKCRQIYHVSKNRFKPHNIPRFSTFLCDKCYKEYNKSLSLNINTLPIAKNIEDFDKLKIDKPFKYTCKNCGKTVIIRSFRRYRIKEYSRFLCKSCYSELVAKENPEILEKRKRTVLNKYGKEYICEIEEFKEKVKQTKLEKYGDPYYTNREGFYKNFKSNHNGIDFKDYNKLPEIKEKIRQTNLQKYGVEYGLQCKEIREKAKQTKLKKYGDPFYTNQKAALQTKLKRFGRTGGFIHHFNYYGIYFDSKPELAVWIYCIDNNIPVVRAPCQFEYMFYSEKRHYIPDFWIQGIGLVEIKGDQFLDENTGKWICPYDHNYDKLYKAKYQCAIQNNVKILYKNDYIKYLEYIRDKYSNILYDVYDINNPYNPSYWVYYINNTYIPNYYNNSNYSKGIGISPYDINSNDEYTICKDSKGISPFDINKNSE